MRTPIFKLSAVAALFLAAIFPCLSQQPAPRGDPGVPGGPRGAGRVGPFGPQLPPEQQAEVDRLTAALEASTRAVAAANSNLVATTFSSPTDKGKIATAHEDLAKARSAWASQASKLFAETQATDRKLSQDAINRLVQLFGGGRGGRGLGPPGGGPDARELRGGRSP